MRSILCALALVAATVPQAKACDAAFGIGGCGVQAGFASGYGVVPQAQFVSGGFGFQQRGFVQRGFVGGGFNQGVVVADPFLNPPPQTVIIQERPIGLLDIAAPFIFDRGFRGRSFGRGGFRGFDRGFGPRRGFDRGFGRGGFGRGRFRGR